MKSTDSAFRFAVLLLLSVFAVSAFPQSQSNDAHLSGTLTDSSGATLSDVRVTAQPEAAPNAPPVSTTSTPDGHYNLQLPPGKYRVQFSLEVFSRRQLMVELSAGATRTLDVRLVLEPLSSSVVVTAQAVPSTQQQTTAPTDIITREDIDERQAVMLPDVLLTSPGVAIGRTGINGGTASLFLNGGNSNFTKVLVDGSPINPPGSAVDFSNIALDNIDKVEVVRGAESAIYGTDAVSGVVQLFSHRGTTRVPAASLFAEGGSYSSARGGGQISGLLGRFDYSGAASYLQTAGEYPNSDFINRNLSGNVGYSFSDTNQLNLSVTNNAGSAGIPGQILITPPSLHQRYDQHIFSANARWDFQTGAHWHHQIMGADSYTRQHNFNLEQSYYIPGLNSFCPQTSPTAVPNAQFCDFTGDSLYRFNRASVSAQSSYLLQKVGVTTGYQYEVENAGIPSLAVGHVRRNNQGGYLDFRYSPISRVSLDFGVRAEANGFFGTRVVPRAGGSAALRYGKGFWGETRLRAFYGQGIKEPRFDQLYNDAFGDFGNPLLKPETSKTWSAGFEQKLANGRVLISAEYFSNRFYNIVSFEFCTPQTPPATGNSCGIIPPPGAGASFGYYFNTDRTRARGTNIVVEAKPLRWLMVKGNYTYDDSLVIASPNASDPSEIAGNRLLRRPPHSGSLTLNAGLRRINVSLAGYFSGVRTDSDFLGLSLTPEHNPGYARFDVAASYKLTRSLFVTARATNLFDKQYQDALGYPALGRDYRFGLRYQFAGRN